MFSQGQTEPTVFLNHSDDASCVRQSCRRAMKYYQHHCPRKRESGLCPPAHCVASGISSPQMGSKQQALGLPSSLSSVSPRATVVGGFQESLPAPAFLAEDQRGSISSPEGYLSHAQPRSVLFDLYMAGGHQGHPPSEGASQQAEAL